MALIDEYKQAVQDVLDGNTKEPPRPSAFPDEQDMLAALYAAAAALSLSKEASGGGGGAIVANMRVKGQSKSGDTKGPVVTEYELDKTAGELWAAVQSGTIIYVSGAYGYALMTNIMHDVETGIYSFGVGDATFFAESDDEYPVDSEP